MPPKAKVTSHPQILRLKFFFATTCRWWKFPLFKQLVIFVHPASWISVVLLYGCSCHQFVLQPLRSALRPWPFCPSPWRMPVCGEGSENRTAKKNCRDFGASLLGCPWHLVNDVTLVFQNPPVIPFEEVWKEPQKAEPQEVWKGVQTSTQQVFGRLG